MILQPSDPDVQTIVSRIVDQELDLQPDFQRGEVWSKQKQQRLIDTILREWHVPPIHVIEVGETGRQEVLDGQQRLVAIRAFVENKLVVDGKLAPLNEEILALDGSTYSSLPPDWRRRFDRFTIRVFRISNYQPEEPGELFFRLNQPTYLTTAEQRNAFFGPARAQVKELVSILERVGLNRGTLGFSNSRMAYDDVLARTCFSLESGSLLARVTADALTRRYRAKDPFREETLVRCEEAIKTLGASVQRISYAGRFNKATLFSWLCVLGSRGFREWGSRPPTIVDRGLAEFATAAERKYFEARGRLAETTDFLNDEGFKAGLLWIFTDRATSRVADVLSVISRDAVIWTFLASLRGERIEPAGLLPSQLQRIADAIERLRSMLSKSQLFSHAGAMSVAAEAYVQDLVGRGWGAEL